MLPTQYTMNLHITVSDLTIPMLSAMSLSITMKYTTDTSTTMTHSVTMRHSDIMDTQDIIILMDSTIMKINMMNSTFRTPHSMLLIHHLAIMTFLVPCHIMTIIMETTTETSTETSMETSMETLTIMVKKTTILMTMDSDMDMPVITRDITTKPHTIFTLVTCGSTE